MKNVLVTGHTSMIGRQVVELLGEDCVNHKQIKRFDLTKQDDTLDLFRSYRPQNVIHLAGYNGGISFNLKHPSQIFEANTRITLNVLNACQFCKVDKILSVISSCAYPDLISDLPLEEEDLWSGPCNSTVECHGNAKRILDCYSRFLNKEFGLAAITCVLPNNFGPFDRFSTDRSKAIAGLIRRIVEVKKSNSPLFCYGTGSPTREFVYCKDAAKAIVQVFEKYNDYSKPLNVGFNQEYSIAQVVDYIVSIVDFQGDIIWDKTRPDGQMRKTLNSTRFRKMFPDLKPTPFLQALQETVSWYMDNREVANAR